MLEVDEELLEAVDVVRLLVAGALGFEAAGPKPWMVCDCEPLPKPGIDDPVLPAAPVEPLVGELLELLPPVRA